MSHDLLPRSGQLSLIELIKDLETSEHPELGLLTRLIDRTQARDPEMAEAMRYCAIPRRFNAEIIGVLRGSRTVQRTNERLLASLLAFSFVHLGEDGDYVYHDSTRDLLLADW